MISVITIQGRRIELPFVEHETVQRLKIRLHDQLSATDHLSRLHLYSSDQQHPWKANELVRYEHAPYFVVRESIDSIPKRCLHVTMEPLPDDRPCFWKMTIIHHLDRRSSFGFSLDKDSDPNSFILVATTKPTHVVHCDLRVGSVIRMAFMPHMNSIFYQVMIENKMAHAGKFRIAIGQSSLRLNVLFPSLDCSKLDVSEIEDFFGRK